MEREGIGSEAGGDKQPAERQESLERLRVRGNIPLQAGRGIAQFISICQPDRKAIS